MNKRLTNEELTTIRERAEKATKGPWLVDNLGSGVVSEHAVSYWWNGESDEICSLSDGGEYIENTNAGNDAAFIAHAREDIPRLLAEIERLRNAISWGVSCGDCTNQLAEDWEIINGRFVCNECRELYIPFKHDGGDDE